MHFKKDNELFIDNTKIIYSQKQEKRKEKLLRFQPSKNIQKKGIKNLTLHKTILLRIVKPIFKTSYKFNVCNSFYYNMLLETSKSTHQLFVFKRLSTLSDIVKF